MLRIGVLVSGGGTNLQAILDGIGSGKIPDSQVVLVLSSTPNAFALERAKGAGIPTAIIKRNSFSSASEYDLALVAELQKHQVDLVLLAGFMSILGADFFTSLKNRVMNVHPALIPAFSGPGYYGLKVHEAVLDMGCKVTGASVHFVTPEVDAGPLILQKAVEVREGDTPESLQKRVMEEAEWQIYPEAVRLYATGRLKIQDHHVKIIE